MKIFAANNIGAALACLSESTAAAKTVNYTDEVARRSIEEIRERCQEQNINLTINIENHLGRGIAPHAYDSIVSNLKQVEACLKDAPLSQRILERPAAIRKGLEEEDRITFNSVALHTRLLDFTVELIVELQAPKFLCISSEHREMYEQKEPPFGQQVADAFPDASRDISAAARCFALDEWTACVAHLMRALESPLKIFADRIGVAFPGPTELENWKSIVDQMESKLKSEVKRLEQTEKSLHRNEELQFLGDVAIGFRDFKNAWRNDVAHGREWYDEREADRVYRAVKHFMQKMAGGAWPSPSPKTQVVA